jgi:hypothetical protein
VALQHPEKVVLLRSLHLVLLLLPRGARALSALHRRGRRGRRRQVLK